MNVEKIIEKIIANAKHEASIILDEAANNADEILKNFTHDANDLKESRLTVIEHQNEELRKRIDESTYAKNRKLILKDKQDLITLVFEKSYEEICNLPENEYAAFLVNIILNSTNEPSGELVFAAKESDGVCKKVVDDLNKAFLDKHGSEGLFVLSSEKASIERGLVVKYPTIEINFSIERIVLSYREELSSEVASILGLV